MKFDTETRDNIILHKSYFDGELKEWCEEYPVTRDVENDTLYVKSEFEDGGTMELSFNIIYQNDRFVIWRYDNVTTESNGVKSMDKYILPCTFE